jgi:hypothetical protein
MILEAYFDLSELKKYKSFHQFMKDSYFYPTFKSDYLHLVPNEYFHHKYSKVVKAYSLYTEEKSNFGISPWFDDEEKRLDILLGKTANPNDGVKTYLESYFAGEEWANLIYPILSHGERFFSKLVHYKVAFESNLSQPLVPSEWINDIVERVYLTGIDKKFIEVGFKGPVSLDTVYQIKEKIKQKSSSTR